MEKDKAQRIKMVYGYAVCVVAVITFLICITSIVYSVIDLGDPLNAHRTWGRDVPSLASFENYKIDIIKSIDPDHGLTPDDKSLKAMYEAARADAIAKVKHDANRSIIVNGLLLILSISLFVIHWIWLRRISSRTD